MQSLISSGIFQTTCHQRHFWLSVKSSYLGSMIRFDFEGTQAASRWYVYSFMTSLGKCHDLLLIGVGRPVWSPPPVWAGGHTLWLHRPDQWRWRPDIPCLLPGLPRPQPGRSGWKIFTKMTLHIEQTSQTGPFIWNSLPSCLCFLQKGTDYFLRLWFVNSQTDGSVAVYPLQLRCSLLWPWGTREIICEENYMEASNMCH